MYSEHQRTYLKPCPDCGEPVWWDEDAEKEIHECFCSVGKETEMDNGYYYFHNETKNLIWKKFCPEYDSSFVQKIWPVDITDRGNAWTIFLEALAFGLKMDRAKELATKWKLTQDDFEEMLIRIKPTQEMQEGALIFLKNILGLDVDKYWGELPKRKGE